MERWAGRVALVTGASSGIGHTLAKELTRHGMKVAALARRLDKLQKLEEDCKQFKGLLKAYKCDVTIESDIASAVQTIVKDLGPVSVLVNNAGFLEIIKLTDPNSGSCRKIFETNVIGLVTFTQQVVDVMKKHEIRDGHIINMNSIAGHCIFPGIGSANYCASKNAVTVLTESLRNELSTMDYNTRVTSISPGFVETEMSTKYIQGKPIPHPHLSTDEVVECIIFILKLNPNINISEMTIQPVKETILSLIKK